jgi:hypothetical protein
MLKETCPIPAFVNSESTDLLNRNGQSRVFRAGENGEKVAIVRPLKNGFGEIETRKSACSWYEQNLPEYTQETSFAVIDNPDVSDGSPPCLARVSEFRQDVQSISSLPFWEVIGDQEIITALIKINQKTLDCLKENYLPDFGYRPRKGDGIINMLLFPNNVFVGKDAHGERSIFCDPDHLSTLHRSQSGRIKTRLKFLACAALTSFRLKVFKGISKALKNSQTSDTRISNEV